MSTKNAVSIRFATKTRAAALILVAGGSFGAPTAGAIDLRPVAMTGASAGNGLIYDRFSTPTINNNGKVLFWTRVAETSAGNDECKGAIELDVGEIFVTTVGASDSPEPGGCATLRDAWYKYTATEAGQVLITASGTNFAGRAAMYRGTCGALTDQRCQGFGIYELAAGETVYVRVGATEIPETGTFTIRVRLGALGARFTARPMDEALFSDRSGKLEQLLRRGDVTDFNPDLFHTGIQFPVLNDAGTVALAGGVSVDEPITPQQAPIVAAFTNAPDGVSVLVETEMQSVTPDWFLPPPRLSAAGTVAYARLDGASLRYGTEVIASGSPAPGLPTGVTLALLDQPIIAPSDALVFHSTLAGPGVTELNDRALWLDRDGVGGAPIELLARCGESAPGASPSAVFASLAIEPAVNATAGVTFWASLSGGGVDATNNTGLWTTRGSGIGSLALLARTGDAAPGVEVEVVFDALSRRPAMNAPGDVAFSAFIRGTNVGVEMNSGIWVYPMDGEASLLAREGDAVGVLPNGVVYAGFSEPVMNDRGDIAFVAKLRGEGVTASNSTALLLVRGATDGGGSVEVIARTGDVVQVGDKDARIISEIDFATSAPGSGRASLNANGDLVFQLYFTDQSSGVFITGGACTADINTDGVVNSQDFFDFLFLFFAGDTRADVNRSGTVDSQDFFDFLGALFGGC